MSYLTIKGKEYGITKWSSSWKRTYSHLATLQEVTDNDYNLHIPRYVDTFEEEEPIDIHAVMKEIKELEAKRADLDKEIEGYLKELGLV